MNTLPRNLWKSRHYPILKISDFEGYEGMLIADVAALIGRSYWTTRSAIHRLGIRHLFPAHGGAAIQTSIRGYCE